MGSACTKQNETTPVNDGRDIYREDADAFLRLLREKPDHSAIVHALNMDPGNFLHSVPPGSPVRNCRDVFYEIMKHNTNILNYASDDLRSDKDFVMDFVKVDQFAFSVAAANLQDDIDVVKEVMALRPTNFKHASDRLKKDKKLIMQALAADGRLLEDLTQKFRNDPEIVLQAVKKDGYALQYAGPKACATKEVMMTAVGNAGSMLKMASPSLKNDWELVMLACEGPEGSWHWMEYAGNDIKKNKDLIVKAAGGAGLAPKIVPDTFINDRDVILAGLAHGEPGYWTPWERIPQKLRNEDRDVVMAMIEHSQRFPNDTSCHVMSGYIIREATDSIRNDVEIVTAAVQLCAASYDYASDNARASDAVKAARMLAPWVLPPPFSGLQRQNFSEIYSAAYLGDAVKLCQLISEGADPRANSDGPSIVNIRPLHIAAAAGQAEIVKLLLKARALASDTFTIKHMILEDSGPLAGHLIESGSEDKVAADVATGECQAVACWVSP